MNSRDITTVCLGVMCARHSDCQRYENVNGSTGDQRTIANCMDGSGYVPMNYTPRSTIDLGEVECEAIRGPL